MSDPNETPADASESAPDTPPAESSAEVTQPPQDAPESPPRLPFEAWVRDLRTPLWVAASAKTLRRWPEGFEVTREDYDAACDAARNEVIR